MSRKPCRLLQSRSLPGRRPHRRGSRWGEPPGRSVRHGASCGRRSPHSSGGPGPRRHRRAGGLHRRERGKQGLDAFGQGHESGTQGGWAGWLAARSGRFGGRGVPVKETRPCPPGWRDTAVLYKSPARTYFRLSTIIGPGCLTSEFGMGSGISSRVWAPDKALDPEGRESDHRWDR